jgi:hypothetical protein
MLVNGKVIIFFHSKLKKDPYFQFLPTFSFLSLNILTALPPNIFNRYIHNPLFYNLN